MCVPRLDRMRNWRGYCGVTIPCSIVGAFPFSLSLFVSLSLVSICAHWQIKNRKWHYNRKPQRVLVKIQGVRPIYSFARPAIMKYHPLRGLNKINLFSHGFEGRKFKIKVPVGLVFSEASFLSDGHLLAVSSQGLSCVPVFVSMCVCVCPCILGLLFLYPKFLYKDTSQTGLGSHFHVPL